ncbi:MAG: NUDIX hydrolase [Cyclobacteriaceae bacterium]
MSEFVLGPELRTYSGRYQQEAHTVARFEELLASARAFHRDHLPGHFTGSAWVTTPDRMQVVLVHHLKLGRWLQPGGHADGNTDLHSVACRELEEETGLKGLALLGEGIYDLDIHQIPARPDFPAHWHYDVRFAFLSEPVKLVVSHESHDVRWVPLSELGAFNADESLNRMKQKLLQ